MGRKDFEIRPEKSVGKTLVLYKGSESELSVLRDEFDNIRSSEVYPSFEEGFESAVYFYETSEAFLSTLYKSAKSNLHRKASSGAGGLVWPLLKYGFFSGLIGLVLWFLYYAYLMIVSIMEAVQSSGP